MLGGGESGGGSRCSLCVCVRVCVCVHALALWLLTIPPIDNLEPRSNEKKKKKQTTLSGPHNAHGPDDVTCHLQLMKVMMACMSAAYVHHLLGSTTLELLPTMLQRGVEARLYHSVPRPPPASRWLCCEFNHTFTPQSYKSDKSLRPLFLIYHLNCQEESADMIVVTSGKIPATFQ